MSIQEAGPIGQRNTLTLGRPAEHVPDSLPETAKKPRSLFVRGGAFLCSLRLLARKILAEVNSGRSAKSLISLRVLDPLNSLASKERERRQHDVDSFLLRQADAQAMQYRDDGDHKSRHSGRVGQKELQGKTSLTFRTPG